MFYGREDVFSFIRRNLIGRHRDTPVVLYGQRRTGKTSVLYQLHRHLDSNYRCIFIDLHGLNLNGVGNLLLGIANSISRGLRREHQITVKVPDRVVFLTDPRPIFQTFLDDVWSALGDDHLVLMLDEVVRLDEEVRAGRLEREVFDFLRHLMQHHVRLNFIFSLGSGLEEMAKDYAFLFSVSLYHRISFLEPEAARNLITKPVRDHYQVTPQAVKKITQTTSGHPYYTQLVCHCLFDLWSRSPKPEMSAADVDTVLAETIELGSANLTYVWEDSTPGEKALMAGMAATKRRGTGPVTIGHVRDAWSKVSVALPDHEVAQALRSLSSREIIAGRQTYSFTVDLQRLWIEKHRRLDWVKEELAETIQQWDRSAEPRPTDTIPVHSGGPERVDATGTMHGDVQERGGAPAPYKPRTARRGRYLAIAAALVLLVSALVATAAAHVFPFSNSNPASNPAFPFSNSNPAQNLTQLLPGNLVRHQDECHAAPPTHLWSMPGVIQALRCTDPGLPGGNVYLYRLDSAADFQTAWQNFNAWWRFVPSAAGKTCPPKNTPQGMLTWATSDLLPQADSPAVECGFQVLNPNNRVPAYAWYYPTNDAFVVAQGASGSSFSALVSWLTHSRSPSPSLAANVAPLEQLLPGDLGSTASQCHAQQPPYPWKMPGLVQALNCADPNLPGGTIYAFQMDSSADFLTGWQNFNAWWGFDPTVAKNTCPPSGLNGQGTYGWNSPNFPTADNQVVECEWVGNHNDTPAYAWALPTEDTFLYAVGAERSAISSLDNWWKNDSDPAASPKP